MRIDSMVFIFAATVGLIFLTGLLVMPVMVVFPAFGKYFVYMHLAVFIPINAWFISWVDQKYGDRDE